MSWQTCYQQAGLSFNKALGNKPVYSCFIRCHRKLQSFTNVIPTNRANKMIIKGICNILLGYFLCKCFLKVTACILKFAYLHHYEQLLGKLQSLHKSAT